MAPLLTLLVMTVTARLVGWSGVDHLDGWPSAIAVGLAAMFTLTGVAHFVNPKRRDLIAIVRPQLPAPALLVTITGVLELLGAAGLVFPPTRAAAAAGLFALLVVMFPANVRAARMPDPPSSMTTRLGLRTAIQGVYLAAAVIVWIGGG
ncbi:DoxX family protein [Mycolicibacterium thermoresistibile]